MSIPLIGITGNLRRNNDRLEHRLGEKYTSAIQAAGGLPVILPPESSEQNLAALPLRLDGILFSGGVDVEPRHFNGDPHPLVEADEHERDEFEIKLVKLAIASGCPILGICRGCQVINVAMGGSLYTHIPEQHVGAIQHDRHDNLDRAYMAHLVRLDPASTLAGITGKTELQVNSLHHQGIKDLAPGLTATGWCVEDGLIEAVEIKDHPYALAVQWHPEEMQQHTEMQALFHSFVNAAESYHTRNA